MVLYKNSALWSVLVLVVVLGMVRSIGDEAQGATLSVTSMADIISNDGDCTLREAIINANNDNQSGSTDCLPGSGADTISFLLNGSFTLTVAGTGEDAAISGDLDITDDLTIMGNGQANTIIDGGAIDRVFHITDSSELRISDVTIRNGRVDGDGGGIFNDTGKITLDNIIISENTAAGIVGGGIFNRNGTITIKNTTITDNIGIEDGGGIANNSGTITIHRTIISGNSAEFFTGGGIHNNTGLITLDGSIISENFAYAGGGGVRNVNGVVEIVDSTVSGNRDGEGAGGGISNFRGVVSINSSTISANRAVLGAGGIDNQGGIVDLFNTTVSSNSSDESPSGGILNRSGTMTFNNSTITSNDAHFMGEGGGLKNIAGTVKILNTIIAGNWAATGQDCSGLLISLGHNLIGDATTCRLTPATGDLVGSEASPIDSKLGPLRDNGGPTFTHAPLAVSPAVDAGNPAVPGSGGNACAATDQRAVVRPQGKVCDIGAFELEQP